MVTHQDIADRIEALGREHSKAYEIERARINAERSSLQELCGGVGHIWGSSELFVLTARRCCRICGAQEPGPTGLGWIRTIDRKEGA